MTLPSLVLSAIDIDTNRTRGSLSPQPRVPNPIPHTYGPITLQECGSKNTSDLEVTYQGNISPWYEDSSHDLSRTLVDLVSAKPNIRQWLLLSGFPSMQNSSSAEHRTVNSHENPPENQFEPAYAAALEEVAILHEALQIQTTSLQMQDARRSLRETHSVGWITQLAFIFLPLTFITGVFGMNLKPISTPADTQQRDGAPMWQFWIMLAVVLVPVWSMEIMTLWDDFKSKGTDCLMSPQLQMVLSGESPTSNLAGSLKPSSSSAFS
ncbi:hypothetical protein LTR84_006239 [Exophiala bonariae]|uniref:Cation-transporting P-type ATPase C-terminal domain-containing protein n=1 Tax=Exophiala bonariae TaxID=1690606 RepID=A0AAV9N1Y0_9EURO|nr:hypothetical protein LTR84_006239 [Exophiala bonariae]